MRILAEESPRWQQAAAAIPQRMWLTTAETARVLAVSTGLVRRWARAGELPSEITETGQHLFRRADVRRLLIDRSEAQARSRAAILAAVRVHMLTVGYEPRQLSLFARSAGLHIVARGERRVPHAEPKALESGAERELSDRRGYVDRRAASR